MERVLQQILHGPAERSFSYVIGNKALQDDLERFADKPKYRRLVVDFEPGEDPDEAYSSVPYEKGANLLLHLERTVGGLDVFLPYIRNYVESFSGKSISTQQWKDHLYAYFQKHGGEDKIKALDSVDWDAWFYGEGVRLPVQEKLDLTLAEQAYALADRWDAARATDISRTSFAAADMDGFNSNQKVVFLERLQGLPPLPATHITHLGNLYGVANTPNAEIRFRFYQLALLDPGVVPESLPEEAAKWVVGDDGSGVIKGRAKFCRPVFRSIARIDRVLAVKYFEKHKAEFHPIARKLIEKDIGIQ
jgi:leukotriene-A4 hydrolase